MTPPRVLPQQKSVTALKLGGQCAASQVVESCTIVLEVRHMCFDRPTRDDSMVGQRKLQFEQR